MLKPRSAIALAVAACTVAAAITAHAQTTLPGKVRRVAMTTTCGGSPCSGAAPSAASDGVSLQFATGLRLRLCADSGQTLSGAGAIAVYVRDETDGLWTRVPALDKTVPASASGLRCIGWDENAVQLPYGSVVYIPAGVTESGGNLTVSHYISTPGR